MSLPKSSESTLNPSPLQAWRPAFSRADLLHLAIGIALLIKQRWALWMMGMTPGPAMLLAGAGAILVLTAWVRRTAGRWQIGLWMLLSGLITLVMYADILYYRQFGDLVSIASLRFSAQLGDVSGSVTKLILRSDVLLWADLPVLAALLLLPGAVRLSWFTVARKRFIHLAALAGIVVIGLVAAADPVLGMHYKGHTMVGSRMGLLNYHAFDIGAYVQRLAARLGPKEGAVREVRDWFSVQRAAESPASASPLAGAFAGKNVIVLQVESLQSFPLGLKIGGQEVTPNLNGLVQESLYFANFYHQTGQGVTSDADFLTNCSLHPARTGAVYYDYAHNDFRCMPTLLRENGYKAVAMQGMPADFWNLSAAYPHVGFERYDSIREFTYDENVGIGLSDESFLRQSVAKLKALPQPYYAFLVTLSSHGPFYFDDMPWTLPPVPKELVGSEVAAYLNAVRYTDQAIGHFVARLKAEGLLDNAILVVYGDHQGLVRTSSGMAQLLKIPHENEVAWTQAERRVPLILRLPNAAVTGERKEAAGQADIAPTLAGLLGIPTDSAFFIGRDLLANPQGIVPFYRGSAVDETHLYFSADDNAEGGACYDLASGKKADLGLCSDLSSRSATRLRVSRLIVERDLITALRSR